MKIQLHKSLLNEVGRLCQVARKLEFSDKMVAAYINEAAESILRTLLKSNKRVRPVVNIEITNAEAFALRCIFDIINEIEPLPEAQQQIYRQYIFEPINKQL